jgi:hypothetical protein
MFMVRLVAALVASLFLVAAVGAADKAAKNQMVKGTIKSVDTSKKVLIVNQKVKDETVERQLDIRDDTEFEITIGGETKTATGKEGLAMLEGKEGAEVKVKCDKDVNVLKVTATVKK